MCLGRLPYRFSVRFHVGGFFYKKKKKKLIYKASHKDFVVFIYGFNTKG